MIVDEAEDLVRTLAAEITRPRLDECLACYLDRMLRDACCDHTLRWSSHYRDVLAPRGTALERQLADHGGYCDCEVLMNVYWSISDDILPCRGPARGSTKPCALWKRHRRGDPWF